MYQVFDAESGELTAQVDEDNCRFVKWSKDWQCWIRADKDDAECVAIEGVRHNILGKPTVDDAENVVVVRQTDIISAHFKTSRDLADIGWGMQKMAEEIVELLRSNEELRN